MLSLIKLLFYIMDQVKRVLKCYPSTSWSIHRFRDTGNTHTLSSIKLDNEEAEEHLTEKSLEIL